MAGGIRLPNWEELSKDEQVPIINLPLGRNYIVTGPPGTGKTVMALYRAARWRREHGAEEASKVKFVVYNKPLQLYLRDALTRCELPAATAQTWHSWLYNFAIDHLNTSIPELSPYNPDWDQVEELFAAIPSGSVFDFLILDEAQDFPKRLIQILRRLSQETTIFADEFQGITDRALSVAEIMSAASPHHGRYYLTKNYRNSSQVAAVADLFWTDQSGTQPAQATKPGEKPRVIGAKDRSETMEEIAIFADNNPALDIGVLLPHADLIPAYYKALVARRENSEVQIQYYRKNNQHNISFDCGGIKLLSYNTHKGLEFDAVFMPEIGSRQYLSRESNQLKMKLYVACSRAKDFLTFIYEEHDSESCVLDALRSKRDLLHWRESSHESD